MSAENQPDNYDSLSAYEKFAIQLFDDTDQLFTIRHIEQEYPSLDIRSMFFKLSQDELALVGSILESYAIDAPEYVEMRLDGRNPYNVEDAEKALLAIRMEYRDIDGKDVESYYRVKINYPDENRLIVAHKSVDVDKRQQLYSTVPIDRTEQRGLLAMIHALKEVTGRSGGRHRRED